MKNTLYILTTTLMLLFAGCDGFLDEKNKSSMTSDKYYATAAGFNELLNVTYSSLRDIYGSEPYMFCAGTDLYITGHAKNFDANNNPMGAYYLLDPSNPIVFDFYVDCYQGIGKANAVMFYANHTDINNPFSIEQQKAEARFIRAFYYFHLVQQFGGVPIVVEMSDRPILTFPRNSEDEVYDFIITEMEAVKGQLAAKSTGNNYGHIDQRTANHILAKIYLTRGWIKNSTPDFTKAKDYALAAIGTQTTLSLPFAKAYSAKDYRNDEVLWSVIYSANSIANSTSGNVQQGMFGGDLDGVNLGHQQHSALFAPTLYTHWLFAKDIGDANNDSRYDATFMEYVYFNSITYYNKTQAQLDATEIVAYFPPWWKSAYSNTESWIAVAPELRKNTMIKKINNPGDPNVNHEAFKKASEKFVEGYQMPFFYPVFRKFDCAGATVYSLRSSFRDIDIARLNDTYLTLAETYIKLNDQANAATWINKVRERSINATDANRNINASQATIDFILEERARELLGHYDRWYDLKRTGTLVERTVKYNPDIFFDVNNFKGVDGNNKILRPIPQSVIDANKAEIKQNPGYL